MTHKAIGIRSWSLIATVLAASLGVTACDSGDRAASESKGPVSAAAPTTSDATITANVKAALDAEPKLAQAGISVATEHGRVTLSGRVPTPELSAEASAKARSIRGVQDVQNRLEVAAAKG